MIARLAVLASLLATGSISVANSRGPDVQALDFTVFLDDSRIGYHHYEFSDGDAGREVRSEASFDVKFLFVTAFKYRHELAERWVDGCLVELEAKTDSNGKRTSVAGEQAGDSFVVESAGEQAELGDCVMTFAYWNPGFLEQPRLLNPQTGQYLDVEVEDLGVDVVRAAGTDRAARGYTVRATDYEVTVWYAADDNQWLALESPTKGGRTIRYELI